MALAGHCARAQDFLKGEGTARQVIGGSGDAICG